MTDSNNHIEVREANSSEEIWKSVPGYEGRYAVSTRGRVMSYGYHGCGEGRAAVYGYEHAHILPERIDGHGYPTITLPRTFDGRHQSRTARVHTLVLTTFIGPRPVGMECRHLDGDKTNNHVGNLCWGTRKENVKDSSIQGTHHVFPPHAADLSWNAKLTSTQVTDIREEYARGGVTQKELGIRYGVVHQTIHCIVRRKIWVTVLTIVIAFWRPALATAKNDDALRRTFDGIIAVESHGDPRAYNASEKAAGLVQIRPIMLADIARILGKEKYTLADRFDPQKSWEMFRIYSRYYAPNGGPEIWARNWVGGPRGYKKASTAVYWLKVKARMR